jgi:hypothetical protein
VLGSFSIFDSLLLKDASVSTIPKESMQVLGLGWEPFEENLATLTRDLFLRLQRRNVTKFQTQRAQVLKKFSLWISVSSIPCAAFSTPKPESTCF